MKKKCLLFVFLLAGVLMVAQTGFSNPPDGQASESLKDRLSIEDKLRKAIVDKANLNIAYSDEHTGKTFKAIGKEWRVGQYNINWEETQSWISSLGGDWRTPTRAELRSLREFVEMTSAIGWDLVWTETDKNDSSSAWFFSFFNGHEFSVLISTREYNYRAVAVR